MFVIGVSLAESKHPARFNINADWTHNLLHKVILMIQTWAVWERDRRLSIRLPIFFVSMWAALCFVVLHYLRSIQCKC
jgi:hypothetical protein